MKLILLFDGHTFDMGPQGTSTFLAGLINALPSVASQRFPGVTLDIHCAAESADSITTYVKVPHIFHQIRTGFLARNLIDLPRLSRHIMADVIVSQYVRPVWAYKHTACIIHDLLFIDFPQQFSVKYRILRTILFGLSAWCSSSVFTVSNYSRERIADIYRMDIKQISLLANAITPCITDTFEQTGILGRNPMVRLLYVSRFEQRKRQDWCIRVFEDLVQQGQDIHLTLIGRGSGEYASQVLRLIEEQKALRGERITHLEGVSNDWLDKIYAETDVFLFPSLGEGFGIPVIEAASHGVPCVVADGSALSELSDYYAGKSFVSENYPHFLRAVQDVIKNLDAYKIQAEENVTKLVNHFSWNTTAYRFLDSILALEK